MRNYVKWTVIFLVILISCQQEGDLLTDSGTGEGNLLIRLQYPEKTQYDSAVALFKASRVEIKKRLTLNNASEIASGHVAVPAGDWNVSIFFYLTGGKNVILETTANFDISITADVKELTSQNNEIQSDGKITVKKSFLWKNYYNYCLYLDQALQGFVRLPKDPTDPFIEISTFNANWTYAYADRLFYNRSLDGSSAYYQAGGAFEVYDSVESIIDTTSFKKGISLLFNKKWNYANSMVIIYDDKDHELFLFHVWDLRIGEGKMKVSLDELSETEIKSRNHVIPMNVKKARSTKLWLKSTRASFLFSNTFTAY
jgi:hypothetical protein